MGMALVDKIPSVKAGGLEFGDAAKGLIVAGAGDALGMLAQRFIPGAVPPVGVKLGVALLIQTKPAKDFLGKDAAMIGSLFLVADAIRSLYDIRGKTATTMVSLVGGIVPAGNAAAMGAKMSAPMQANQVVQDYYSRMYGGR